MKNNTSSEPDAFQIYQKEIAKIPFLTEEEEVRLIQEYRANRSRKARERIITSHLHLVASIIRKDYKWASSPDDLVAEGNIGLMLALDKFDPAKGRRFSTLARFYIRNSLRSYLMDNRSMVKMGTSVDEKRILANLERAKKHLGIPLNEQLRPENVKRLADIMNVPKDTVVAMMGRMGGDLSLNDSLGEDKVTGANIEFIDTVVDENTDVEADYAKKQTADRRHVVLMEALDLLDDRKREMVTKRRLTRPYASLQSLATEYGISRERVRQIEAKAYSVVEAYMLSQKHRTEEQTDESV